MNTRLIHRKKFIQKNSKSYDNRSGETSSNVHLKPRDYQINDVNKIIYQRHQYGVFVEGPTSLPRLLF